MTDGTRSGTAPARPQGSEGPPGRTRPHGPEEPAGPAGPAGPEGPAILSAAASVGLVDPAQVGAKVLRVSAARREGRGHRTRGTPCQDAFAVWQDPRAPRAAAAVADGLGSKPLSHLGSEAAAQAAVASLAAAAVWDDEAIAVAFEAARAAVQRLADERGVPIHDLATTLQVVTLSGGTVVAGMVGDGAVVAGAAVQPLGPDLAAPGPRIVVAPADAEYSNEVVPLTYSRWREFLRSGRMEGAAWAMAFTDGLTRLLLSRGKAEWQPFQPFFDAFVPTLAAGRFDEDIAGRLLMAKNVDASWDDDKCLVVIADGRPA